MLLDVKVVPRASREEITVKDGVIRVYVRSAPDKGKANKAVIALIAKEYKVRKSDVHIVRGQAARNKVIEVLNNE